jgi:diaminopropionate ammonia-lyase
MRFALNPFAERSLYTPEEAQIVSLESAARARTEISGWPEYKVTPLRSLPGLAAQMTVGEILYKDESQRLGRGSFKALGGAYAATLRLRSHAGPDPTLSCATDGNHGLSVAYAAKRHGCACVVFMHEHAHEGKVAAIRELGARIIRTPGTYDDSIQTAARAAADEGWLLVADTSDDPRDPTTLHVMQGYGVMVLELIEQLGTMDAPSHVFIQAGVGGLAASVVGVLSEHCSKDRPTFVVVEPETAACLLESTIRLRPSKVDGDLRTEMAMLSAGEPSAAAWPLLERRIDAFLTIDDSTALSARAELIAPKNGDPPLDVGISGAAGAAGLMQVRESSRLSRLLGLSRHSRIVVFGTEGGRDELLTPSFVSHGR